MSEKQTLLFLHGVGDGDQGDLWKSALEESLRRQGYPGLDGVAVLAPKYANALNGVDDGDPVPGLTVKAPKGDAAKQNRRAFERRECAVETLLGKHDAGAAWLVSEPIAAASLRQTKFKQAQNYLGSPRIRAHVLTRILKEVPRSGRLVIVGHSLGSVIAADVIRRLPVDVHVAGFVTIGSPLSSSLFHVDDVRETLKEPPTNLAWWVNLWHPADPVTMHRGVSSVFPWMTDYRVDAKLDHHVHDAVTYLGCEPVARSVGYALHGSSSTELTVAGQGLEIPVDEPETLALIALRYAYLVETKLDDAKRTRYTEARRQVQATAVESLIARRRQETRPLPRAVTQLFVDLEDPDSVTPEPDQIRHVFKDEAVLPLVGIMTANVIQPFEISVPTDVRVEALEDLCVEMGLGRQFARDLLTAERAVGRALTGDGTNWVKWAALGLGAVALVVATGGLVIAAAPGVAGAAAITSALAAFGPGGMIGGLLTAGALVGAGGGGVAVGLASPATTAETVEAYVSAQLTAVILRTAQGLDIDLTTWENFAETGIALRREHARLQPISDRGATALTDIDRKLRIIDRALNYLGKIGVGPDTTSADDARPTAFELFERATEAFRSVDLDGDGVPDKPRARTVMEDAGTTIRDAATGAFGALRRRRSADGTAAESAGPGGDQESQVAAER